MSSPHSISFEEIYISKTSSLRSGVSYLQISFDPEVDEIDSNESTYQDSIDNNIQESIVKDDVTEYAHESNEIIEQVDKVENAIHVENLPVPFLSEGICDTYEDIAKSNLFDIIKIDLIMTSLTHSEEDTSYVSTPTTEITLCENADFHIFNISSDMDNLICGDHCCDTGISLLFQEHLCTPEESRSFVSPLTSIYQQEVLDEIKDCAGFSEEILTCETHSSVDRSEINETEECPSKPRKLTTFTSARVAKHIRKSLLHRASIPMGRTSLLNINHQLSKKSQKDKQSSTYGSNIRTQTPHMKSYIALRQQCRMNDFQLTRLTKETQDNKIVKRLSNKYSRSQSNLRNTLVDQSRIDIQHEECTINDPKLDFQQETLEHVSDDLHSPATPLTEKTMNHSFISKTSKFKAKRSGTNRIQRLLKTNYLSVSEYFSCSKYQCCFV